MPLPSVVPGSVDELAVDYARLVRDHDPVAATQLGIHERDHELPEIDEASLDARRRALRALLERAAATPADGAGELDRRGLVALLHRDLIELEVTRSHHRNPLVAPRSAVSSVFLVSVRDFLPADHRRRAIAGRCAAVPGYLAASRKLLEPVSVPPLWAQLAVASAAAGASFFRDAVPAAVPEAADAASAAADALDAHAAWIQDEVAPVARGDLAAGRDTVARLLADHHLLDETPESLQRRGEELLARTRALLVEAAGTDDWAARLAEVKADHPDADGLLDAYRAEVDRLRRYCLDNDLVTDPEADATVEATPPFLRPVMGYAAYLPMGPFDEHRVGRLWITPPADPSGLADHAHALIPAIAGHEGYPGHHLQLTSVNRLASPTRRLSISTVMIEGWGLYVEELLAEVGYYTPEARLAQLAMTALRAARIVADMGLHTGAMTVEEAVDLLVAEAGLARTTATSEVSRYTMSPTQPSSYLIGAEEIRRIRAAYRDTTGASLRAFHDALLSYGHLPPALAAEGLLAA